VKYVRRFLVALVVASGFAMTSRTEISVSSASTIPPASGTILRDTLGDFGKVRSHHQAGSTNCSECCCEVGNSHSCTDKQGCSSLNGKCVEDSKCG